MLSITLAGRGSFFVCLISGADPVWSSGYEDPCTARGKAARIAAVAELHDGNTPEAPAPAEYRNGAGSSLGQTEATAEAAAALAAHPPQRHGLRVPGVPLSGG
ncbi:hypothetical protein U5640_12325 [Streptomyces sp. SS7]|uniref:hypothetical protein n=1 Tax=Streptomyces sp. SS7 TaxID=3108485 RepID=UPI0030ED31B8